MPRNRMISPEFWSDEEIGIWSHSARLFYIGLWNFADDEGRFKAHNQLLKSQIFPYDIDIDIEALKKELNYKIQWYDQNGSQYGHIRNFLKHQRIDKPYPSKLPPPPPFDDHSPTIPRTIPPKIKQDKIKQDKIKQAISPALKAALDKVYKEGLNIYALINKLKKRLHWKQDQQFPDEILFKVCELYHKNKIKVKDRWPWFCQVIKAECEQYFAAQNIREHKEIRNKEGFSIGEILEMAKKRTKNEADNL